MRSIIRAALALSFCLPLAACEHDHDEHEHEDTVDQVAEGCKHMEFGPEVALSVDPADPPAIETFHTRYDMTLAPSDDGYAGALQYTSVGGMHFLIFDQAIDFTMTDASGAVVEPMMIESDPTSCELAAVVHHVMLPAGAYDFAFDGAQAELLKMVVHVAGQDHSHAH